MRIDKFPVRIPGFNIIILHLLGWAVFILYELSFLYIGFGELESAKVYFCYYSLNIGFFYGNVALLNFIFKDRATKYLIGSILFIGLLIAYCIFKLIIGYFLINNHLPVLTYFKSASKLVVSTAFRVAYFFVLSTFYWATWHISQFRTQAAEAEKHELIALKENAELETRLAHSRNAYLKHQLNPHLLFNSLNFIYNSVYQNSPDAAQCVLLLSEIMRFSLEETGPDGKIPLSSEIEQLGRLIEINRYRFDKPLSIAFEFSGFLEEQRIIPLILFTLTENLFKHGNLLEPKYPTCLMINVDGNGRLTYFCKNLKRSKNFDLAKQHIGIKNVRLRLDFAYPGDYSLDIIEDEDFYQITLIINI